MGQPARPREFTVDVHLVGACPVRGLGAEFRLQEEQYPGELTWIGDANAPQ